MSVSFPGLLPFVILAATAVALLLAAAFRRSHPVSLAIGLVGLAAALVDLLVGMPGAPVRVTPLLLIDAQARFYLVLVLLAAAVTMPLAYHHLERREGQREEYYVLLVTAALGASVLVAASHFASFFLGLELLTVSLYALIAYPRAREPRALEAGMKYLILAGASSAFLLFGMALVYADLGEMGLREFSAAFHGGDPSVLLLAGLALMIVGIGFKLGLVPFHFWTPDVYEGAPEPVAAFVATSSKGAVLALVLRHLSPLDVQGSSALMVGITIVAVASILGGNLLALLQPDLKRILGASSIAHMGYASVAFIAGGKLGAAALAFYLVAYFATMLGLFGLLSMLSDGEVDGSRVESYRGLASRRPWLAASMTAMLLSLAGMPLTAGFVGKFYLAVAGAGAALWVLLAGLVVGSVIGLFYYLRVVVVMFDNASDDPAEAPASALASRPVPIAGGVLLSVVAFLLLWLGIYPAPLLRLIEATVQGVF